MTRFPSSHPAGDGTTPPVQRQVLVDHRSGAKPLTVNRLAEWVYLEQSLHRLLCGWGRYFGDWCDMVAVHRQVWEASECVRRLRERLLQFPGTTSNLELPVSRRLEKLVNTVLLAPTHQDAVDGIYHLFTGAMVAAYGDYALRAHPVHDAPTLAILHDIIAVKESLRLWRREYRRRYPHVTDAAYKQAVRSMLEECDDLQSAQPVDHTETAAAPCGVNTCFRLPRYPARPAQIENAANIMPLLRADFPTSVESRRLFWCFGYQQEMNLAVDQLRWLWEGHFLPWEWQQDISRHLWDESRHGDSGRSRLQDFGIALDDIGFPPYEEEKREGLAPTRQQQVPPRSLPAVGEAEAWTPLDLYEQVFNIGLVAETGHFTVKREAYQDFKDGEDLESAEMMLFDIIDENNHVQYAHKWLPLLADMANEELGDYRTRAVERRRELQQMQDQLRAQPVDRTSTAAQRYERYLAMMREQRPLKNAATCPPRSPLPM